MTSPVNIEIDQGTNETVEFTWLDESTTLPIDLTNYTAKMQVRAAPGDSVLLLEYKTDDASITLGGPTGIIDIFITAGDTNTATWSKAFYDLFVTNSSTGAVSKIASGMFIILSSVTLLP